MESEENNYPVPIYDEDCKYIINHESFEATSSTSLTLTKLKSQSDDKKSANTETRRDSFLNDKNKLADFRSSNLKNSPLIGKKPSGQKIEERLSLNNNAQTQDSKSTKPTHGYNKQSSIGSTVILFKPFQLFLLLPLRRILFHLSEIMVFFILPANLTRTIK